MMVGRDDDRDPIRDARRRSGGARRRTRSRGEKVLSVENVTMGGVVKNMSFSVFDGEVVGIFGLVGAGRTEIAQIVCGARKRNFLRGGMIYLRGKPIRYRVPRQAMRDGIAYITEDRKVDGFFETMTVDQNIYLGFLSSPRVRRFFYSTREMKRVADQWITSLSISALKRRLKIVEYSGGNQQKVVVAQVARAGAVGRHFRRADARRRRQRHSADSRGDSQARRGEQGGRRHLVLSAGNSRYLRSHPGGARRANRRGNGAGETRPRTRSCTRPFIGLMSHLMSASQPKSTFRDAAQDAGSRPAEEGRLLSERIADEIRSAVLSGEMRPGMRIRQELLAAHFGASRIPVREALKQLENEGLVVLAPNRGAWIADVNSEESIEVYKIREAVEPLAILESVPNLTDADIDSLDATVRELEGVDDARGLYPARS